MEATYIFIGIFISLSVYHLLVFSGRTSDYSNIVFTLFCAVYAFFLYWNSIFKYSSGYSFAVFHVGYAIACIVFAVIYIVFPHTIVALVRIRRASILLASGIVVAGAVLLSVFMFTGEAAFIREIYALLSAAMLGYIGLVIHAVYLDRTCVNVDRLIVFIGYGVLSCFLIFHTAVLALFLDMVSSSVIRVFFSIMTFAFSYSLTRSFNREHRELVALKESLEIKVAERTRELSEAKKQKETFFINIAHEIKTPLTIVTNLFHEFYMACPNPGELRLVKAGLDKMKNDIVNFLDLHKLESGKTFYDHARVSECRSLLEEVVPLFAGYADRDGKTLSASFLAERAFVRIDPLAFERIINNLLENAIKYNKENGTIVLELSVENGEVRMRVCDTGIGIPEDVAGNIFSPYFQASHRKRNIQGLGMGLAIVREICDHVGARISVRSSVDEGTDIVIVFRECAAPDAAVSSAESSGNDRAEPVLLPALDIQRQWVDERGGDRISVVRTARAQSTADSAEKPTVFLVEDNPDLLAYLTSRLSPDYDVIVARDGNEAIGKIARIPEPDIIVSDIMMDGMDGLEFRDRMKTSGLCGAVPFVFLTALTSKEMRLRCLADGAVDYIVKPFSADELFHKIAALIAMRRAVSEQNLERIEEAVSARLKVINKERTSGFVARAKGPYLTRHGISDQEIRIIAMLKEGLQYKEIAANLSVSINSVRTYVRRIHRKLGIHSTAELFLLRDMESERTPL